MLLFVRITELLLLLLLLVLLPLILLLFVVVFTIFLIVVSSWVIVKQLPSSSNRNSQRKSCVDRPRLGSQQLLGECKAWPPSPAAAISQCVAQQLLEFLSGPRKSRKGGASQVCNHRLEISTISIAQHQSAWQNASARSRVVLWHVPDLVVELCLNPKRGSVLVQLSHQSCV